MGEFEVPKSAIVAAIPRLPPRLMVCRGQYDGLSVVSLLISANNKTTLSQGSWIIHFQEIVRD